MAKTKVPSIPPANYQNRDQQRQADAIREALNVGLRRTKNDLDSFLTLRDLQKIKDGKLIINHNSFTMGNSMAEIRDGVKTYTWYAWADDQQGNGFTTDRAAGALKDWFGMAAGRTVPNPSQNYADYVWTRNKANIDDVFTSEQQAVFANMEQGKLPDGSDALLGLQSALTNDDLSNLRLTGQKLVDIGIWSQLPASGATVGADWGSNVAGLPANLAALSGGESILNSELDTRFMVLENSTQPMLDSVTGLSVHIPSSATLATGHKVILTSDRATAGSIRIRLQLSSKGFNVGMNGVAVTSPGGHIGVTDDPVWYSFDVDNIKAGDNEISIWSPDNDIPILEAVELRAGASGFNSRIASLEQATGDYAQKTELTQYVKQADLNTTLNSYVTSTALANADYATNTALTQYVRTTDLNTTLNSYVTTSALASADYASNTSVTQFVQDLAEKAGFAGGMYEGDWFIDKTGEGFDFVFPAVPTRYMQDMVVRIDQHDLESGVQLKVNGNVVSAIHGADNVRETKEFAIPAQYLNSASDNVVRIEHAGGPDDWGHIYQVSMKELTETPSSLAGHLSAYVTSQALANADYARRADLVSYQTSNNSRVASIEQTMLTTVNESGDPVADYRLRVSADGVVGGIGVSANGSTGATQILLQADRVAFVDPDYSGSDATAHIPFMVENGQTYIKSAAIKELTADKISGGAITVNTLNVLFDVNAQGLLTADHFNPTFLSTILRTDPTSDASISGGYASGDLAIPDHGAGPVTITLDPFQTGSNATTISVKGYMSWTDSYYTWSAPRKVDPQITVKIYRDGALIRTEVVKGTLTRKITYRNPDGTDDTADDNATLPVSVTYRDEDGTFHATHTYKVTVSVDTETVRAFTVKVVAEEPKSTDGAIIADWGALMNKPTTFPPSAHSHSYLPLSGGYLSGTLHGHNQPFTMKFGGGAIGANHNNRTVWYAATDHDSSKYGWLWRTTSGGKGVADQARVSIDGWMWTRRQGDLYGTGNKPTAAAIGAAAASHAHGTISNGSYNYFNAKHHANHAWLRNQAGYWSFQSEGAGDDWTRSFTLHLPPAGSTANAVWAELGQSYSNAADGRYRGVRIVKRQGGVTRDGDLRVGHILLKSQGAHSGATITALDGGQYGTNLVIKSGGNTVISAGESTADSAIGAGSSAEDLHLGADATIYFHAGANSWASRRSATFNASGVFSVPSVTVSGNVSVAGDLKMAGTDSYIWTPAPASGFTGLWDQPNSRKVWSYKNSEGKTRFHLPVIAEGNLTAAGVTLSSGYYNNTGSFSYDKVRVWNSAHYTIGMNNSMTHGWLSDCAMTFSMNNDSDRGFVWRHGDMTKAQAAMSLTTNGELNVMGRIGFGGDTGNSLYRDGSHMSWQTPTGYVKIGSANTAHMHFYTDRPNYYFNTELLVDSGKIGSYNEDLYLRRASVNKITVTATDVRVADELKIGAGLATVKYQTSRGGEAWLTNKDDSNSSHKGIGVSNDIGPMYWDSSTHHKIYSEANKGDLEHWSAPVNTVISGAGWVTIAEFPNSRGQAEFYVWDVESGDHSYMHLEAMRSYVSSSVTVLNTGGHARRITAARFIEATSDITYHMKKLQIYVTVGSRYYVRMKNADKLEGYKAVTLIAPKLENMPSGYREQGTVGGFDHEYGGMGTTGKLRGLYVYDGSGRLYGEGRDINLSADKRINFDGGTTYYLREATGSYGTVAAYGRRNSWSGYSIEGRMVFMHDGGNATGIYNDVDNEWMFLAYRNGDSMLYHNGGEKIRANSTGAKVTGYITANSHAGVHSRVLTVDDFNRDAPPSGVNVTKVSGWLDADVISAGLLNVNTAYVKSANISGKLTASQIDATNLSVVDASFGTHVYIDGDLNSQETKKYAMLLKDGFTEGSALGNALIHADLKGTAAALRIRGEMSDYYTKGAIDVSTSGGSSNDAAVSVTHTGRGYGMKIHGGFAGDSHSGAKPALNVSARGIVAINATGDITSSRFVNASEVRAPILRVSTDTDTYLSPAGVYDDGKRCYSANYKPPVEVYNGSSYTNRTYPIGSHVIAFDKNINRYSLNDLVTLYTMSSSTYGVYAAPSYTGSKSTALTGTWRKCGVMAKVWNVYVGLFQRVA